MDKPPCTSCGKHFEQLPGPGRPRKVCYDCRPRRTRANGYSYRAPKPQTYRRTPAARRLPPRNGRLQRPIPVTHNRRHASDALTALVLALPLYVHNGAHYERVTFQDIAAALDVPVGDLYGALRRRFHASKQEDSKARKARSRPLIDLTEPQEIPA